MSINHEELFCVFPSDLAVGDPLARAFVKGRIVPDLQVFTMKHGICFLYELEASGKEHWFGVITWKEPSKEEKEIYGHKGGYAPIGYIKATKKGLKPRGNIVESLEKRKVVSRYDFLPWQVSHYGKEAYEEAIREETPNWFNELEGVESFNPQYFK